MATLVFTAVGQALGGPMGAALGSIIGRSVDESLFGSAPRRGPRLGDLSVQTSSYGNMIPRVYGKMRVAGTVIWATDLVEEETVEGGGKGSAPSQGYKYSVSLAVALSSRRISAVHRIWADGKLIRGATGDLKIVADLRLLNGTEDQDIDPIIATAETIELAPAYRGLAMAVFEGLELGEFGNRIPQFTFEVVADDEPLSVGTIVTDVSEGTIEGVGGADLVGFAAHGNDQRDALETIVEVARLELCDDGLRFGSCEDLEPLHIPESELGSSSEGAVARISRERDNSSDPKSFALSFYDPSRDYQAGQVRVVGAFNQGKDVRIELPAAIEADRAKALAEEALRAQQVKSDRIKVALPPKYIGLVPCQPLIINGMGRWKAEAIAFQDFTVLVDLVRDVGVATSLAADGGRASVSEDIPIGRTEVALIELPSSPIGSGLFAVGTNTGAFKPVPLDVIVNGGVAAGLLMTRKARLGHSETCLRDGVTTAIDRESEVVVRLHDASQILLNADRDAVDAGANLAILGREIFQFFEADALGQGRWRLKKLVRGRWGTEFATNGHAIGETFCLLNHALMPLSGASLTPGATISIVARGVADGGSSSSGSITYSDEASRPPAPCKLRGWIESDMLQLRWVGRTWLGFGWAEDASPAIEAYRLVLTCSGQSVTTEHSQAEASIAVEEMPGTGPRTVNVFVVDQTTGRWSHPASTTIEI